MRYGWSIFGLLCAAHLLSSMLCAQERPHGDSAAELRLRIVSSLPGKQSPVPAVVWLQPLGDTPALPFLPHAPYTLLQKGRTFLPHLQVVPVGSTIQFPNVDPFFHNVFSLFEGKRFDLGLYEAGSSKGVTFSREGASYIFCNIHPEMSAVVLALSTPLYATGVANGAFAIRDIPPGHYKLHLWIEGIPQSSLEELGRTVYLPARKIDSVEITAPLLAGGKVTHTNKFDRPYDPELHSPY